MPLSNTRPARTPTGDPWLLTPGPLTTSPTVKQAMLHDLGSRDKTFIDVTQRMREQLLGIVADRGTHECVLLQGSGTFIVEAMIACFVPRDGKLLVLVNGAYGQRICRIAEVAGRPFSVLEWAENEPVDVVALDQALSADPAITHVTVIHCETTSGILNPIAQIADVVANHCRGLLIDSMSAFGALELDCNALPFDAVVASSNKCLEGVPGMGFCIARREALVKTQGNAQALSLDLYAQWQGFEQNGQWRFTPPVQCLLAFDQALTEFEAEGGVAGRGSRYRENRDRLVNGMRELGFQTLLPDELQAPIIVTFLMPSHPAFDFARFYELLSDAGYVIYPGKLTVADSFRIGCIGRLGVKQIDGALRCISHALESLGVELAAKATV